MKTVDLHVHSNKSDGSFSPEELVSYAIEKGLSAFALSDHDTTEGIEAAVQAAKGTGIEVIPAIEFSTEYEGKDIHILGLYIDYSGKEFKKYLKDFQDSRDLRNRKMCEKLTEHGVPVTYEEMREYFPGSVLTRAHYAKYMWEKGFVKSMSEAFDRYIGDHAPCFLPREKVTPMQAVELILRARGVPILAHPVLYHLSDERLDKLVAQLKGVGLAGIEAIYSTYTSSEERQMRALADKYDLLISGGSDFHGTTKPSLDLGCGYGKLCIPYDILENIKEYRRKNGRYKNRIIFSDMDGTLLDDRKNLSPRIYEAIDNFTAQGGRFVLSSGRPLASILETREKLGLNFPGTFVIAYNGALVYDCEQEKSIWEQRVPYNYVKKVLQLSNECDVHAHTYTDNSIISPKDNEELAYYREHIHMPAIITDDIISALDKEPFKLILIQLDGKDKLEAFRNTLESRTGDKLHTFYSSSVYLECCMKEASKGNAIRFLCGHLGIDIKNSIAAGDAANDISMLQAAGYGVCMCNGTEDAKAVADYVTKSDNNHNGFMEIFDKIKD